MILFFLPFFSSLILTHLSLHDRERGKEEREGEEETEKGVKKRERESEGEGTVKGREYG